MGSPDPQEASVVGVAQGYYTADLSAPAVYMLERARDEHGQDKAGAYLLKQQIRYVSADGRSWTVPASPDHSLETDLASIPIFASWLVPKDGTHTPAALIHDAMVLDPGETPCYTPPGVERDEADRLFREGLQHLGVRLIRRWLMWAAVSIPTLWTMRGARVYRRILIALLSWFCVVGLFGVLDVLDLPGAITFPSWVPLIHDRVLSWQLVGVSEGPFPSETVRFLAIAAVSTAVYCVVWWERWRFALCTGLALSLVTVAMATPIVTFLMYSALEEVIGFFLQVGKKRGKVRGRVRSAQWVEKLAQRV